jgi:hypothetical protein
MDITVILPSRKRTRGLYAVLSSLTMLESGKHRVYYGVCADDDDEETISFCKEMQGKMRLAFRVGERQKTMGGVINEMATLMPAEVYLVINDDILCLDYAWDDVIAEAVEKTPHGVFWWKNAYPMDALYPIVTEKWRQAAGQIFTNHYPFWFDDLCLIEVWMMTTGQEPIRLDISIVDKPVSTQRMRDLKFWQGLYTQTRKLRVLQSYEIAEKLGLPRPTASEEFARRLTEALIVMDEEHLKQIEINQGETSPPDAAYLVAKERAEKILEELKAA